MRVVHIAGADVQVGALLRQRCAWCGALIEDYDLERTAAPVGQDARPAMWTVGDLVAVDGGAAYVVTLADDDPLPADACAQLDPVVTQ